MAAAINSPKQLSRRYSGPSGALSVPTNPQSGSLHLNRRSSLSDSDRVSRLKVEIATRERDDLEIVKKDVCEWLAKTLEIEVSPDNFMDTLDTGVVLCKLAKLIQEKAKSAKEAGEKVTVSIPMETVKCQPKAGKETFFARDNTANFIKWCKKLGVNEEVIFESNGLVQQEDEKRVILCLIDVSRYAYKVNIKPPELVQLENEIELEELQLEEPVFEEPPTTPMSSECTCAVKESNTRSSQGSSESLSAEPVDDHKDSEVQQQLPKQQEKVVDEERVIIHDPVIQKPSSPKSDGVRANTPKEKRNAQKPPLQSQHKNPRRSPHRSPHHREQRSSQQKKQLEAKKQKTPPEEKTDALVGSDCMNQKPHKYSYCLNLLQVVAMVGECRCHSNKLTIRIERSGKYVVRGGRIKDKKIIHARVSEYMYVVLCHIC